MNAAKRSRRERAQSAFAAIKSKAPETLLYTCAVVLITEEVLKSRLGISFLKTDTADLRVSIGIAALLLFVLTVGAKLAGLADRIDSLVGSQLGMLEVLRETEVVDFSEMLRRCRKIRLLSLSGTKAASLGDGRIRELLADPKRASELVILLADPYSDAIVRRYEADEPDTFEAGTEGIRRRLVWLHDTMTHLPASARRKLDVRVYKNYPVVSILQGDRDIYSTSYGYKLRGGDCPKVHTQMDGEYGQFLSKHFDLIYADATPLEDWIERHREKREAP